MDEHTREDIDRSIDSSGHQHKTKRSLLTFGQQIEHSTNLAEAKILQILRNMKYSYGKTNHRCRLLINSYVLML